MSKQNYNKQKQTEDTFSFKWQKRASYESPTFQADWKRWLFEKYFDSDQSRINELFKAGGEERKKILDAGCGSGMSGYLLFGEKLKEHDYLGIDISDAVTVADQRFNELEIPATFIQCDLHSIPEDYGTFDIIFSEGVLHHTNSVDSSIYELSKRLKRGGKFLFYVYSRKAPIREFTDDYIREELQELDNDEAWQALIPLTKLGKILGELNIEVDLEEDIPLLGIKRGTHNIQRLFYYKVCKTYYRPGYSLDEMNHINFDWFRPMNCHRHTPDEIQSFCKRAGLVIERLHIEESGISVIATL